MPLLSFKCPNCDGPLTFDPQSGKYTCEYCASVFTQEELDELERKQSQKKEESFSDEEGAVVYVCPSCGAQIVTSPTTAATYCYYCHNPVIVSGRLQDEWKPDKIIPFCIDRDEAIRRFLAWAKKKRFIPRGFFSKEQIEKLTGVYYPYFVGDFDAQARFEGRGTTVSTALTPTHEIVTTHHYRVARAGDLHFANLIRPALTSRDRALDAGVHPFDHSALKDFSVGYLSGFQAERRDMETDAVDPELTQQVQTYCDRILQNDANDRYATLQGKTTTNITRRNYRYVLLPSWILTYKGQDEKTYYYALNGQTGAVCGDLPIDKGRLNRFCALIGGVVAAVLLLGGWLIW